MACVVDELLSSLQTYSANHGGGASASTTPCPNGAGPAAAAGDDDWRFQLVRSVGEECQTEPELRSLLQRKAEFNLYDGFEPSGRMHIAQGLFKALNVNKCTKAGGIFIFWVADWFGLMNDKMGGDLDKIKAVGQYFVEVWKASGMDLSRVRFRWSSDDIINHAEAYWAQALDIARRSTLARVKKCCQIMGRQEDKLSAAQIMYPIMQSTDIFFLQADICQLGVDQRKVNMLARDYCDAAGIKNKPIILSHHMLLGLIEGQAKMSKSNPDSAIFMEDSPEDVERKIRKAYCPKVAAATKSSEADEMQLVKDDLMNPCLDYVQHILFSRPNYSFKVGSTLYATHEDVKAAFLGGEISEDALKDRLIEEINLLLDPVRKHFSEDATAKDLLAKITQWKKENLVAPTTLKRLQVKPPFSKDLFVVFAPLPRETLQVEEVLGVLGRLKEAPKGSEKVLWLEDWTALALGCVGAQKPCIKGFYDLLLFGLRGLGPELMKDVRVCWQGEMILSGPSEYWISVINAGRIANLDDIRKALPPGESLEHASEVFATLMHIGDVLALTEATKLTLCCDAAHENVHKLALKQCEAYPEVMAVEVKLVESPKLRLLEPGDGVEADVNVMLTDKEIDVNKKVKKSFCMPENIEFNPPIAWVEVFLGFKGEFLVSRKPDNGGDQTYTDVASITADFKSGVLHPGDLKPALSKAMNAFLEPLREGLKGKELAKAQKDLEAFTKAQSKKK